METTDSSPCFVIQKALRDYASCNAGMIVTSPAHLEDRQTWSPDLTGASIFHDK